MNSSQDVSRFVKKKARPHWSLVLPEPKMASQGLILMQFGWVGGTAQMCCLHIELAAAPLIVTGPE